mmetsp:Transcript_9562/g.28892  ORF Transcript_9562/g.28892 Transcript_9562/m.28892 type:complete len:345 (+) Transcript_9562:46-1080(+)
MRRRLAGVDMLTPCRAQPNSSQSESPPSAPASNTPWPHYSPAAPTSALSRPRTSLQIVPPSSPSLPPPPSPPPLLQYSPPDILCSSSSSSSSWSPALPSKGNIADVFPQLLWHLSGSAISSSRAVWFSLSPCESSSFCDHCTARLLDCDVDAGMTPSSLTVPALPDFALPPHCHFCPRDSRFFAHSMKGSVFFLPDLPREDAACLAEPISIISSSTLSSSDAFGLLPGRLLGRLSDGCLGRVLFCGARFEAVGGLVPRPARPFDSLSCEAAARPPRVFSSSLVSFDALLVAKYLTVTPSTALLHPRCRHARRQTAANIIAGLSPLRTLLRPPSLARSPEDPPLR